MQQECLPLEEMYESFNLIFWPWMDGWMDGWMDLLSGTGVATALGNVQWPKPFHTPAQPLRLGWLFQRTKPLQGYNC